MLRLLALLAACSVLPLAACGGGGHGHAERAASATPAGTEPAGCRKVPDPGPKKEPRLAKPRTLLQPGKTYVATVSTNCGDFDITLDSRRAPRTGGSFAYLVGKGFYDGTTFHRIVPGFVIQGGDPKETGEGGPGYSVVETPPRNLTYTKGMVAMAKTQLEEAGTSGSQFFVVTADDAQLPPDYALLGKVTRGQDVVDRIGVQPTNSSTEKPVDPIVISSIKLSVR